MSEVNKQKQFMASILEINFNWWVIRITQEQFVWRLEKKLLLICD